MTSNTSTADKRGVEYMYIDYSTWLSRPILVGDPPKEHEVEYVRLDLFDAMQARAEKAEAENERLRDALSGLADCTKLATGECDWPEGQDPLSRARAALERKEGGGGYNFHIEPIDAVEVAALHVICGMCGHQNLIEYEALDQETGGVDSAHDFQHCEECDHICDASKASFRADLERKEGGTWEVKT